MKVICVDDSINTIDDNMLTLCKIYEVMSFDGLQYLIKHDGGGYRWFNPNRFITLEEYRQNKLNKLGIT